MDLYIRSQDRLILEKNETLQLCQNPDGTWFFNSGLVLGTYKSKKRALEILDEIQQFIENDCKTYKSNGDYYTSKYEYSVYEMPQE